jgi:uncharacterized protein
MLLYLKIKPNQRFNGVEVVNGEWVIRIKAPAIDGKANEGLVEYLSEILRVPKSRIKLTKGATSKIKCLDIDAPENEVLVKLAQAQ